MGNRHARQPRPRWAVRLSWLLALVLILAVGLAWLTDRTRRNRGAIATASRLGGYSSLEEQDFLTRPARPPNPAAAPLPAQRLREQLASEFIPGVPVISLDGARITEGDLEQIGRSTGLHRLYLNGTTVSDAGLRHLRRLGELQALELSETRIGDAGLAHLAGLLRLEKLWLFETRVGDAGLVHLRKLSHLQELHLGRTAVGDDGLAQIGGLTGLRELRLQGTRVTDAGLAHLSKMTRLQVLDLRQTAVSDAGLKHLARMSELRVLLVDDTRVSEAGLSELRQAMHALQVSPPRDLVPMGRPGGADSFRVPLGTPECGIRHPSPSRSIGRPYT